jgi:hypothetical protein
MRTIILTFLFSSILFVSCSKDDDDNGGGTAATTIKITDAPVDDANITAAFVTISDIKLDGFSVAGFSKTTVNLYALQNGATQTLGNFSLTAQNYSTITFILDFDTDASGGSPGSYVVTTGGVKHKLQSTSNVITIAKGITLLGTSSNSLVVDFDLRKMITHTAGADHYDFATAAEMASSIRIVVEGTTGTINGTVTDAVSGSAKVIAYAYKKGTFNRTVEMSGQGTSNIQFKNAVSSDLVSGGSYELHFLETGMYEVHFASYKDTNADNEMELQGTLVVTVAGGLNILDLSLAAGASLTVNATATAVLP